MIIFSSRNRKKPKRKLSKVLRVEERKMCLGRWSLYAISFSDSEGRGCLGTCTTPCDAPSTLFQAWLRVLDFQTLYLITNSLSLFLCVFSTVYREGVTEFQVPRFSLQLIQTLNISHSPTSRTLISFSISGISFININIPTASDLFQQHINSPHSPTC